MRVLVIGANGFIGAAVVAAAAAEGYEVWAAVRRVDAAARGSAAARLLVFDLAHHATAAEWAERLDGIDAVVNCAGALQDGPGDSLDAVHRDGPAELWEACRVNSVRRVIHFSAIGVDRATPSPFSVSKLAGDSALMAGELDWVILRPSVVVGPGAYGAGALLRGLAALPIRPAMPATERLQLVMLDDVVRTVLHFLGPAAPGRVVLDLAGPQALTMSETAAIFRRWLGWPPGRDVVLPRWASRILYRAGDLAGQLGWRPPMRSNARQEIRRGALGDPSPWIELTGAPPLSLAAWLCRRPATVEDRWFARLHILRPLLLLVFAVFWVTTAYISVGPGYRIGVGYMLEAGAGMLAGPSVIAGALADLAIGLGILWRRTTRGALYAAMAISVFYAVAGSLLLPRLWLDPLGPMVKIWPIMALNLVLLAILDDR